LEQSLNTEYTKRLKKIEEALEYVCPPNPTGNWVTGVTGAIPHIPASSDLQGIHKPIWALLERGGKRWRPLVMVLSYELFEPAPDHFYPLTALVELPHNGSLIVDDIEDGAEERRGGPAVHLIHGMDMAINSGNHLYFLPTYLFDNWVGPQNRLLNMMKDFNQVMRRLHFGQGMDIQWHNQHNFLPGVQDYLQMCRFKTGALARLGALLGARAAGADDEKATALGQIWETAGVGFQILDDVKNLTTGNPGKMRGDDFIEGKKSLPVILHGEMSADRGQGLLGTMAAILEAPNNKKQDYIENAIGMVTQSGALQAASDRGEQLLEDAKNLLVSAIPASEVRDLHLGLMEMFQEQMRKG
jgi:geranylgeranyl pyrophosphate synthase